MSEDVPAQFMRPLGSGGRDLQCPRAALRTRQRLFHFTRSPKGRKTFAPRNRVCCGHEPGGASCRAYDSGLGQPSACLWTDFRFEGGD